MRWNSPGRKDKLPFPRQAGSWYHLSKVHASHNTHFACKMWGIAATDIMQGVVFGTHIAEMGDDLRLRSRLDSDECFGTAINRQAVVGHPLLGASGQKQGFLPLIDSMACLRLAVENPPEPGEYRVFNQFEAAYTVAEPAEMVQAVVADIGLHVEITHYDNPRKEMEEHYYNPDSQHLLDLGYQPTRDIKTIMKQTILDLIPNEVQIARHIKVLVPDICWDSTRKRSGII